jgi:Fe-S cluster assembly iron-binding protein IscA
MEGARDMIQVTERARETFKNKLEELIERPGVMLRIGSTDSGLEIFPDTLKDDDQIIEHDGHAVLLIDQAVSETLADTTIDVEEHADGARVVVWR